MTETSRQIESKSPMMTSQGTPSWYRSPCIQPNYGRMRRRFSQLQRSQETLVILHDNLIERNQLNVRLSVLTKEQFNAIRFIESSRQTFAAKQNRKFRSHCSVTLPPVQENENHKSLNRSHRQPHNSDSEVPAEANITEVEPVGKNSTTDAGQPTKIDAGSGKIEKTGLVYFSTGTGSGKAEEGLTHAHNRVPIFISASDSMIEPDPVATNIDNETGNESETGKTIRDMPIIDMNNANAGGRIEESNPVSPTSLPRLVGLRSESAHQTANRLPTNSTYEKKTRIRKVHTVGEFPESNFSRSQSKLAALRPETDRRFVSLISSLHAIDPQVSVISYCSPTAVKLKTDELSNNTITLCA